MADVEVYDAAYVEALEASVIIGGHVNPAGQLVLERGNGEQFNAGQVVGGLDTFYPVGSVYTSFSATSPSDLFGGTWARIKDRVIVAVGDNPRWDAAGEVGGAETVVLTRGQLAAHDHAGATGSAGVDHLHSGSTGAAGGHGHSYGTVTGTRTVQGGTGVTVADSNYTTGSTAPVGDHAHNFTTDGADRSLAHTHSIAGEGANEAHENMPPFISAYVWRRTA